MKSNRNWFVVKYAVVYVNNHVILLVIFSRSMKLDTVLMFVFSAFITKISNKWFEQAVFDVVVLYWWNSMVGDKAHSHMLPKF